MQCLHSFLFLLPLTLGLQRLAGSILVCLELRNLALFGCFWGDNFLDFHSQVFSPRCAGLNMTKEFLPMRVCEVLSTSAYESLAKDIEACDLRCECDRKLKKKSRRKSSTARTRFHSAQTPEPRGLPTPIHALPTMAISQLDIQKMGQGVATSWVSV